jgi:hypothetical protein
MDSYEFSTLSHVLHRTTLITINGFRDRFKDRFANSEGKEVHVMNVRRMVHAVVLLAWLMGISTAVASAEEGTYELKPAAMMKALLTDMTGKRVVVRLESGEELEGTVTTVGDHLVHLSKLSRREFFDAFVGIERIGAVIIRVR